MQLIERCELAPHCYLPWIEQVLEGRTPHAIRNRFYRLQQQQQQQQEQELQGHAVPGQVLAPV